MNLQVDISCATSEDVPDEGEIRRWIGSALAGLRERSTEISVRVVDRDEMVTLNKTYRGKIGPTNVLSFPLGLPDELELPLLGDIVICAPVLREEALAQGKTLHAHWAHIAVHGTLHLLGYDHIGEAEATAMEALESAILSRLDYPCPYRDKPAQENLPG